MATSDLGRIYVSVSDPPYDDSDTAPLHRYPWNLMMDEWKNPVLDRQLAEFLKDVFNGLAATGRYGCWLMYHFTDVIATNDRDGTA